MRLLLRQGATLHRALTTLLPAACFALFASNAVAVEKSSDEKIAFYQARLGGKATYPAHARLGLAYLEKFRETGKTKYYDDGIRFLRQSLSYQRNFEALLGLAVGLSERHCFKDALPYAEEALTTLPSDLEAAGVLFDTRLALGQVAEAEDGLKAMLKLAPGFHAWSRQAALCEYRGDLAGALDAMTKARDDARQTLSKSTVAWAEVRLGSLHLAQGQSAEARDAYDRALSFVPGYFFADEHLAEWHAAHGKWPEAEKLFRHLLKLRPGPQYRPGLAEACRAQGKVRESKRQTETALSEWRQSARAGAQDPFRPLALLLLENAETAAEGLRWAERDWEVRQDPLAADTLAWAQHCNGHGAEALRLSERTLASGSKRPALLFHCGLIQCRWGSDANGRVLLKRALKCPLAFGPDERRLAQLAEHALGPSAVRSAPGDGAHSD